MTYQLGGVPLEVAGVANTVRIRSSGAAPATLDAQALSRHFVVSSGAQLTLYNIVLTNGLAIETEDGGSVLVSGSGSVLRLFNVLVSNCNTGPSGFFNSRGGGIFASDGATVNATSSTFINNTAAFGGSICTNAGFAHVDGCTFRNGFAARAGFIGLQRSLPGIASIGYISNSDFFDGVGNNFGGAVYTLSSFLQMNRCQLFRCVQNLAAGNKGGGAVYGISGLIWDPSPAQVFMTDVYFEDCESGALGGGLHCLDYSRSANNRLEVRLDRVTFQGCRARSGGGAHLWHCQIVMTQVFFNGCSSTVEDGGGLTFYGTKDGFPAQLEAIDFTGCTSVSTAGSLSLTDGAQVELANSSFTASVAALDGGCVNVANSGVTMHNVSLQSCTAQGGDGGGLSSTDQSVVELTHVRFIACAAELEDGGGLSATQSVVDLIDTHFIECSARFDGAMSIESGSSSSMTGGSIARCFTSDATLGHVGALRLFARSTMVMLGVSITDCSSALGSAVVIDGNMHMTGCQILRSGSSDTNAWGGAVEVADGGVAVLQDTLIEGVTPDGPPSPPQAGCANIRSGANLTLQNVSLSSCENSFPGGGRFLHVDGMPTANGRSAHLVSSLVNIAASCSTSSTAMLRMNGGNSGLMALRGLRLTNPSNCDSSQLLAAGTSIAACSELASISGSCGTEATCTDVPTQSILSTTECSCEGENFALATPSLSAELLPYHFGCFTQREAHSVTLLGTNTPALIFMLIKSDQSDETNLMELEITMEGTDPQTGADWQIETLYLDAHVPHWISLPQAGGSILPQATSAEQIAEFTASASSAMVPGRERPYEATLNVSVLSGKNKVFPVPVFLYVTATTINASWGEVDASTSSCAATMLGSETVELNVGTYRAGVSVVAGSSIRIPFVGCDKDGLKNARDPMTFTATATGLDGTDITLDVDYDAVTGNVRAIGRVEHLKESPTLNMKRASLPPPWQFEAIFSPNLQQRGSYLLSLRLAGVLVAAPLEVEATGCPAGSIPSRPGSAESCTGCTGVTWAFPGDATCGRCREGLHFIDGEGCVECPASARCIAGSTVATLVLESGHWRLSNETTDIYRCLWYDAADKTPCIGGAAGSLCRAGHHGPLCSLCDADDQYFNEDDGNCVDCPEEGAQIALLVGIVLAMVVMGAALSYVYYSPPSFLERSSMAMHAAYGFIEPLGLWPKLKQLIAFFQILFNLGSVYRTSLPSEFHEAFEWIHWITFDLVQIYPPECIGTFTTRLLLTSIAPLVVIPIVMIVASASGAAVGGCTRKAVEAGVTVGGATSVIISWVLVAPVSKTIFETFDCQSFTFEEGSNTTSAMEFSYLYADRTIRCSSESYDELTVGAAVLVVIWPVAVPIMLLGLLSVANAKKPSARTPLLKRATDPLSREYDRFCFYWEVVEIYRRIILSGFLVVVSARQGTLRLTIAMLTCFLYLILLFAMRPFKRADDTVVAATSNVLLVFIFLITLHVKLIDEVSAKDPEEAERIFGTNSSFDIAILLVVIGFIQLACVVGAIAEKLRRAVLAAQREQQARNRERVKQALASHRNLRFPAVFVTFDLLRQWGKFTSHETVRSSGGLHFCDTFQQLSEFTRKEATVFVSHQWLSFTGPDSNGTQYRALVKACEQLCELKGLTASSLYVWLDYVSIPQVNNTQKQLAIDTLAVYASACRYFIVLAPDANHTDTLKVCDEKTYSRRGWCRLELWANATSGFTGMYVFGHKGELEPRTSDSISWSQDAVFVFDGEFTMNSDKFKIVDTVLGLWSLCLNRKGELYDQVVANRERAFPKKYFGNLPELLEEHMENPETRRDARPAKRGELPVMLVKQPTTVVQKKATDASAKEASKVSSSTSSEGI